MEFIVVAVGSVCIASFICGAWIGQKMKVGEGIKIPELNPVKIIKNKAKEREEYREAERLSVILENIDRYDGTSYGQKDVPRSNKR